ncbi:hypothetical protein GA845_26485, partial [Burkholderia pseudomallei]|nr:hypothetical protein [Burkholderia pseudomallei]
MKPRVCRSTADGGKRASRSAMRGTGWSAVAQASCQWGACFAANGVNARRARRARKTAKAVGSGLR